MAQVGAAGAFGGDDGSNRDDGRDDELTLNDDLLEMIIRSLNDPRLVVRILIAASINPNRARGNAILGRWIAGNPLFTIPILGVGQTWSAWLQEWLNRPGTPVQPEPEPAEDRQPPPHKLQKFRSLGLSMSTCKDADPSWYGVEEEEEESSPPAYRPSFRSLSFRGLVA